MTGKGNTIIGLVQIGEDFGGQHYLPYAVGLLQAYAQRHLPSAAGFSFLPPLYRREPILDQVRRLSSTEAVFFSAYVWNHRFSLELARRLKLASPGTIVVFGGPQVPEAPAALEETLRRHPFIDLAVFGEGEVPFLKVLEHLPARSWDEVPSAGFIRPDGGFFATPRASRIADLDTIPSPYLAGVFGPLMKAYPLESWQAMVETNRGCPFSCAYCTWGSPERRKVFKWDLSRVFAEIDWISTHRIEFVFCCDANFGLFPERDLAIVRKVADTKQRSGYPQAFSVQSTKNATQTIFQLNRILHEAGLQKGVNLALQSVNPATLEGISRSNISSRTYRDLQDLFAQAGIATFSDIILGLPRETYDTFADGVSSVIAGGQHNRIQFINLSVLENSEMADPGYRRRYGMVVRECRAVSHHSRVDQAPEVLEVNSVVVGTSDMPPAEWVRTRVFCWLASLLHFDKLLQIPLVTAASLGALSYRSLIEAFADPGAGRPVLAGIARRLREKAFAIQEGDAEYIPAPEWLGIHWPADEWAFIKLCREGELDSFYREAQEILCSLLREAGSPLPAGAMEDAIALNRALVRLPGAPRRERVRLSHDVHRVHQAVLRGEPAVLHEGVFVLEVEDPSPALTWEEWYREVVWYGTKRGAYLREWREVSADPPDGQGG